MRTMPMADTKTYPEGPMILFLARARHLRHTLRSLTGWMNRTRGSISSRPFTERTRVLSHMTERQFDQSDEAWKIWEDACCWVTDQWAPPGYCFDRLSEPDETGWAPYGWAHEEPEED
jgi:hypothetical protein